MGWRVEHGPLGLKNYSSLHYWRVTFSTHVWDRGGHTHWANRTHMVNWRQHRLPSQRKESTWRARICWRSQGWSYLVRNNAKTKNSRSPQQKGHKKGIRSRRSRSPAKHEGLRRGKTRRQLGGTLQSPNENWNESLRTRRSSQRNSSTNLECRKTQNVLHLDGQQSQLTLMYILSYIQTNFMLSINEQK